MSIIAVVAALLLCAALAIAFSFYGPRLPRPRRKPARAGDFGPAFWGAPDKGNRDQNPDGNGDADDAGGGDGSSAS